MIKQQKEKDQAEKKPDKNAATTGNQEYTTTENLTTTPRIPEHTNTTHTTTEKNTNIEDTTSFNALEGNDIDISRTHTVTTDALTDDSDMNTSADSDHHTAPTTQNTHSHTNTTINTNLQSNKPKQHKSTQNMMKHSNDTQTTYNSATTPPRIRL
jgi:hypothetical protein